MGHDIRINRSKLHPWLDYKLELLLKELGKKKMWIIITDGYRSNREQNELYAQGRTKKGRIVTKARGGDSQHNWGIAIDIAMKHDVDKDGDIKDDIWNAIGFKNVAKIAKKLGFAWGGDWITFKDRPHLYLPKWGKTPQKLKKKYGTYEAFRKTWVAKPKSNLSIYSKKILFGKKVGKIPQGKNCKVLWKSSFGYAKVRYQGVVGYVKKNKLK